MKRHDYLIPFSRFHRSILFLALIAKKNAPNVKGYPSKLEDKVDYALSFYQNELCNHFEVEEKEVFNRFFNINDEVDLLINEIKLERENICKMFELLKQKPRDFDNFHKLGALLEKHVRKEERQLFQLLQAKLESELNKAG